MRVKMKAPGVYRHAPAVSQHFPADAGELTVKKAVGEALIRQGAATRVASESPDDEDDEPETPADAPTDTKE